MSLGALRGLSIGYSVVKQTPDRDGRRLLEVKLWEVSPVTFPANELATVGRAKESPFVAMADLKSSIDRFAALVADGGPDDGELGLTAAEVHRYVDHGRVVSTAEGVALLPELLDRKMLQEELGGVPRSVVDAIFRRAPNVHLPGLRKPLVRRSDVAELLERSTFVDDGTMVR